MGCFATEEEAAEAYDAEAWKHLKGKAILNFARGKENDGGGVPEEDSDPEETVNKKKQHREPKKKTSADKSLANEGPYQYNWIPLLPSSD